MPSNTGMASATDACGGIITISYSDVVTPGCGNSYTVVRTWRQKMRVAMYRVVIRI